MKCYGCLSITNVSNSIKCSSDACAKTFCTSCCSSNTISKERRKSWKCPDCCASFKKGDQVNLTPSCTKTDSQNNNLRSKTGSITSEHTSSEVKELTTELRNLTKEITLLKQRLETATDSLTRCHERLDELGASVSLNNSRLTVLEEGTKEVQELRDTVKKLHCDLNNQAQSHLRNEIEIIGVPESTNENLHHLLLLATRKIGVDLRDDDIDWVSRAGPRKGPAITKADDIKAPRPIVAKLLRRSKRDHILKMSKTRKNLTSVDIEVPGAANRIFFNERLTKENRVLFRDARARSKSNGYAFCWCSQGTVYVRQREGKAALQILSQEDLDRIFGQQPPFRSSQS